jgi:uncharacterized protein (DUF2132 family)
MNVERMHETERFQKSRLYFLKTKNWLREKVASTFLTQRQAAYKKPA